MSNYIVVYFALHVLAWAGHLQEYSNTKGCVLSTEVHHCQICGTYKAVGTLQPEPTQHSKPTFVWAYIARRVGTFKLTSLSRHLATKGRLVLSLFIEVM